MTEKELEEYLGIVTKYQVGAGFPHFSGVTMRITEEGVNDIKINREPLDLDRTYKMTMLSFLSKGGDDYPDLTENPSYVDSRFVDADILTDYVRKTHLLKQKITHHRVLLESRFLGHVLVVWLSCSSSVSPQDFPRELSAVLL